MILSENRHPLFRIMRQNKNQCAISRMKFVALPHKRLTKINILAL